ncbi:hypothetical protein SLS54_008137 [Diplodia seriata]
MGRVTKEVRSPHTYELTHVFTDIRCIYSIYLLDSQLSIACNLRPQISALEIKYDLPCADDLWSARTAAAWESTRTQHFRSFNEPDDHFASDEAKPSEGSLYGSTQDLLHAHAGSRHHSHPLPPPSPTLRLLWYSPFAALVLVTQLQMTARELTHASCLLERPRGATTQRNLSILTEAQYGQISQALRNIAELIPPRRRRAVPSNNTNTNNAGATPTPTTTGSSSSSSNNSTTSFTPLWHAFWLTHHYTSITISHPDSLLVTGVVETNLPAAIATAGHLARPRARRANRDVYEDRDVFRILRDLEGALGEIDGEEHEQDQGDENPFLTLLAFKICLVGWRIVRLTMGKEGEGPAGFVLGSVMEAIGKGEEGGGAEAEVGYLRWVREALMRRSVWPVGRWEAAIVDEALTGAVEYAAVVREGGAGVV